MEPTFEDDFSTIKGWLSQDSKNSVNTSSQRMDFNADNDGTNDAISYDLVSALSGSLWRLDADFYFTGSVTNGCMGFGLSSTNSSNGNNTVQDFLGARIDKNGSTTGRVGALDINGAVLNIWGNVGDDVQTLTVGSGTWTWYMTFLRTSTTTFKVEIYADSARTSLSYTMDGTCDATVENLQYIKLVNVDDQNTAGELSGYIDNVKVYNGVNSIN